MTYYISGPMTGKPDLNRPAFRRAQGRLIGQGHRAISPPTLSSSGSDTYRRQLKRDLVAICVTADALYMLKGWEHSPGARAEHAVAAALDLPIDYEAEHE